MIEHHPCSLLVLHSCIYFVPGRSANKILKSCCSCRCKWQKTKMIASWEGRASALRLASAETKRGGEPFPN